MLIQPYLFFGGRAEEAIEFYKSALGAEVTLLMRYKDSPEPPPPDMVAPGSEEKVMHATLQVADAVIMVSDGSCDGTMDFAGFSLSISVDAPAEADRIFEALAAGGRVEMPMTETFWSLRFGMLSDRFGVGWMINVAAESQS